MISDCELSKSVLQNSEGSGEDEPGQVICAPMKVGVCKQQLHVPRRCVCFQF